MTNKPFWKDKIDQDAELRYQKSSKDTQTFVSKRLADHGKKFKCCVCDKPSIKPAKKRRIATGAAAGLSMPSDDWTTPGDLEKCKKCRKFTCPEHIYKDICKTCAEDL